MRRERDRVARAIGLIVLGAAPIGAMSEGCSSSTETGISAIDASTDVKASSSDATEEPNDPNGDATADAGSCAFSATPFDAGIIFDAEGGGIDLSCIYALPCGLPSTLVAVGCEAFIGAPDASPDTYVPVSCTIPEGQGCTDGSLTPGPRGELSMICLDCFGGGRRPRGLRKSRIEPKTAVGDYFAKMAHEEQASIFAFARMHEELVQFRAPRAFRCAARRAMREEISHARSMMSLTRARGGQPTAARVRAFRKRSLEAMGVENAVEGCVNETFGAILLSWQSERSTDETLRNAFRKIAADESRHAALSWSLFAWIEKRLDPAANKRILRARDRAMRALARSTATRLLVSDHTLGLPNRSERAALVAGMISAFALG